jgi:alkylated DNA repair dioxygenase AlkB
MKEQTERVASQLAFGLTSGAGSEIESLDMPDADVTIFHAFFGAEESDCLFHDLLKQTNWRQDKIRIYGKQMNLPRLTAWYGDAGKIYSYSGITMHPDIWTENLLEIKRRVDRAAKTQFNSVLLSLYRDGRDGLSWHDDDERELGEDPTIASVSFGETRSFQFKRKKQPKLSTISIPLTHGSLLIMKGPTQRFWVHQVPKTARSVGPRINLTFRVIRDP